MTNHDSTALQTAVTDDSIDLDERDVRALTEYLTVLKDIGRARHAEDLYLVVSQSGNEYLVDADLGACECPDYEYRADDLGEHGCKHQRRVQFATGEREIPAWVDRDDLDGQLGEHVSGQPRQAATDGGEVVTLSEATDDGDDDEPEDCDCADLGGEIPCWECYRTGRKDFPEVDG